MAIPNKLDGITCTTLELKLLSLLNLKSKQYHISSRKIQISYANTKKYLMRVAKKGMS